jgi:hypothetical protein
MTSTNDIGVELKVGQRVTMRQDPNFPSIGPGTIIAVDSTRTAIHWDSGYIYTIVNADVIVLEDTKEIIESDGGI